MYTKFPVAVHIFFIKEDKILLMRRYGTGFEDGHYSVVSGHLEEGETVTQAAIRETQEEIGVLLQKNNLRLIQVMHRKSTDERIDFFFIANGWNGEPINREPIRCDELNWYPIDRLPINIIRFVKRAIDNYINCVWFEEVGWNT